MKKRIGNRVMNLGLPVVALCGALVLGAAHAVAMPAEPSELVSALVLKPKLMKPALRSGHGYNGVTVSVVDDKSNLTQEVYDSCAPQIHSRSASVLKVMLMNGPGLLKEIYFVTDSEPKDIVPCK